MMRRIVVVALLFGAGAQAGLADTVAWKDGRVWQDVRVAEFRVMDGVAQFRVEPTDQSTPTGLRAGWYGDAKRIEFASPEPKEQLTVSRASSPYPPIGATVAQVIQADTLRLDTGQKVRLLGVDTPETTDPERPLEYFGGEAFRYTKSKVEDKQVRIEFGERRMDNYGRLLGYVFLADGTFLNDDLVRTGHGHAWFGESMPQARMTQFREAESAARAQHLGLWDFDKREARRSLWQVADPPKRTTASSSQQSRTYGRSTRRDWTKPNYSRRGRPIHVNVEFRERMVPVWGPFGMGFGRSTELTVSPR